MVPDRNPMHWQDLVSTTFFGSPPIAAGLATVLSRILSYFDDSSTKASQFTVGSEDQLQLVNNPLHPSHRPHV